MNNDNTTSPSGSMTDSPADQKKRRDGQGSTGR
jgi:hypothetical protein